MSDLPDITSQPPDPAERLAALPADHRDYCILRTPHETPGGCMTAEDYAIQPAPSAQPGHVPGCARLDRHRVPEECG